MINNIQNVIEKNFEWMKKFRELYDTKNMLIHLLFYFGVHSDNFKTDLQMPQLVLNN